MNSKIGRGAFVIPLKYIAIMCFNWFPSKYIIIIFSGLKVHNIVSCLFEKLHRLKPEVPIPDSEIKERCKDVAMLSRDSVVKHL